MPATPEKIRFKLRPPTTTITRVHGRATFPLEDLYHYALTRTWLVVFGQLAAAFLLANVGFAVLYALEPGSIAEARPGSIEDAFFFSVQTMATIGYGAMHPETRWANMLVTAEAMIGVLGTAVVTGLTFARFARPTARVLFADKAVVGPRDGMQHLMFRMANWRHNHILDAKLKVLLLWAEKTREGESVRRMHELPLIGGETPLFAMTWTVMHRVDETSPFFGPDALARLRASGAELFVSLQGIDDTFNTEVHARHHYTLDDIVVGARFENVLTVHADGTREIDYRYFHRVVPLE